MNARRGHARLNDTHIDLLASFAKLRESTSSHQSVIQASSSPDDTHKSSKWGIFQAQSRLTLLQLSSNAPVVAYTWTQKGRLEGTWHQKVIREGLIRDEINCESLLFLGKSRIVNLSPPVPPKQWVNLSWATSLKQLIKINYSTPPYASTVPTSYVRQRVYIELYALMREYVPMLTAGY